MNTTVGQLTYAAITVAQMYLDYAARAKAMTPEEASAEWAKVQDRAKRAGAAWDAGELPPAS